MFEYIVTAFKVIVGVFTADRLTIFASIMIGVLLLWVLFSLLFSFQSKFSRGCRRISLLVDTKGLTPETYPKFIELASKLPDSFLRGWKTFEHADSGLPSQYLKRAECLDLELSGGLFNQNRSVIRSYISFFTVLFALLGLASRGSEGPLTAYTLAESLVIPFLFALISMLIYYLYTALRQHQYRVCVEDFNEMLDILNEKVENCEIEFDSKNSEASLFVKNIVDPAMAERGPIVLVNDRKDVNSLFHEIEKKEQDVEYKEETANQVEVAETKPDESENHEYVQEFKLEDNAFEYENQENIIYDIPEISKLTQEPTSENIENTVENTDTEEYNKTVASNNNIKEEAKVEEVVVPKKGRGRPRKEKAPEGELIITTDEQFEEVLARAEKLMKKNEEPLSPSQQKRVEKALKELVDAMKKYKQEK